MIRTDGRELEVAVDVRVPDATVGDLLEVVGWGSADGLEVDGRFAPADRTLDEAGLRDGAVCTIGEGGSDDDGPPLAPGTELAVVVAGGLQAGARLPMPPDGAPRVVGRDDTAAVRLDHPTVSAQHALLWVGDRGQATIEDAGSRNGTWVDGQPVTDPVPLTPHQHVRVGALGLRLEPVEHDDRPRGLDASRRIGLGNVPFNRPPRPAEPPEPPEVAPPERPKPGPAKPMFSPIALLAPIALGAVLVVVLGSWRYALFMAFSPVMVLGNYLEGRRRHRAGSREERERYAADLERFRTALARAREIAVARARELAPHPAELLRWSTQPSTRLWERRPHHADWLRLTAGVGDLPWEPPLTVSRRVLDLDEEGQAVLDAASVLRAVPIPVELSEGGVVGIVGTREAQLAVARWLLVEATTLHGPADLPTAICTGEASSWDWAKWLPHVRTSDGPRMLAGDRRAADDLLASLLASGDPDREGGPTLLLVLDDVQLTEGRGAPARTLLRGGAGPVAGIVLAETEDSLPAMCTTVVALDGEDGAATMHRPGATRDRVELLANGLTATEARRAARALAGFDDPEVVVPGGSLPDRIDLVALLDGDPFDPGDVRRWWDEGGSDPGIRGPLGVSEQGVFSIDLDRDGPHGLLGGTTGSGKSELLRSLVASCSLHADPDHLTWVLIDYKGGSAFDVCAQLPHTVGMVTNLDAYLGERALTCLTAELHHRERVLRDAGASDLSSYLQLDVARQAPLPRLVVVIDEFAQLKNELPEFVDALVGIAQVGRSLGVHLLLATQRPTGAVNDNIRANTNLRIALRMQDDGDSSDIIGGREAARIPRHRRGRGFVRLGPSEVVPIQTALVTGVSGTEGAAIAVAPFAFAARQATAPAPASPADRADVPSDLERLVTATRHAFERTGRPAPRRPWPEPLPERLALADLLAARTAPITGTSPGRGDEAPAAPAPAAASVPLPEGTVPVALADDPAAQRQHLTGWDTTAGNLLVYGLVGSGTTTTLAAIGLALAATRSPDDLHLYVLEAGAAQLGALEGLPHCGAAVGPTERERQLRLLRFLRAELVRRQALDATARAAEPTIVLLLDGYAALAKDLEAPATRDDLDGILGLVADGPSVGILTVMTGSRAGAIPTAIAANVAQKWLLKLADRSDVTTFGVPARAVPPDQPPGRAIVAADAQHAQIGWPGDDLTSAVADLAGRSAPVTRPPRSFGVLPVELPVAEVASRLQVAATPWDVPVGISGVTLEPVVLRVYEGEHITVAGPARSGTSTALATIAGLLRDAGLDVVTFAGRRSALRRLDGVRACAGPDELVRVLDAPVPGGGPLVVVVDDAPAVEDPRGAIAAAVAAQRPELHLVIGGRADAFRAGYGHWTQKVRRSNLGVLLRPDVDLDGDLLGVTLPRHSSVPMTAGRGYAVSDGDLELVQIARPPSER